MAGSKRNAWILFGFGVLGSVAGAGLSGIASSQGTTPTTEAPRGTQTFDPNATYTTTVQPNRTYQDATAPSPGTAAPNAGQLTLPPGARYKVGALQGVQGTPIGGCYPTVSGVGRAVLQSGARNDAAARWRENANSLYGIGDTNHVQGRQGGCELDSDAHAIRRWICTYSAQPCITGGTATPNPEPACYGTLSAEGSSEKLQSTAESHAWEQWQRDAGAAHDVAYRAWPRARNRDMSCRHNGLGPLQRRWICRATGEPCR